MKYKIYIIKKSDSGQSNQLIYANSIEQANDIKNRLFNPETDLKIIISKIN